MVAKKKCSGCKHYYFKFNHDMGFLIGPSKPCQGCVPPDLKRWESKKTGEGDAKGEAKDTTPSAEVL